MSIKVFTQYYYVVDDPSSENLIGKLVWSANENLVRDSISEQWPEGKILHIQKIKELEAIIG